MAADDETLSMFESIEAPTPDTIIALMSLVQADDRPDKVDLTVGVYKNGQGLTPIMDCVRQAEQQVHDQQTSKAYLGLAGDMEFCRLVAQLVVGDGLIEGRTAMAQAPGGSGALRVLSELIVGDNPESTLWLSEPTWPNHNPLMGSTGLQRSNYGYFEADSQTVNFETVCECIEQMAVNDVMVLHGCCHNPTGSDLTYEQWCTLGDMLAERGVVPLVDLAYAGLGDGFDEDIRGTRAIIERVPVTLLAVSCSKNFGIYRERTGCAMVLTSANEIAGRLQGHMGTIARTLYSMPPDHGAAVVRTILSDEGLSTLWRQELSEMAERIGALRSGIAAKLNGFSGSERWSFIAAQKGMFSLLGLSDAQLTQLRVDHGVYMVKGGRVNLAGLQPSNIDKVAQALVAVT